MKTLIHSIMWLLFPVLSFHSCMNRNVLPAYYNHAGTHQLLALLPVQTKILGMNSRLAQADSATLYRLQDELTSAVYLSILKSSGLRERDIKVAFQSPDVTVSRLREAGVDLLALMDKDPVELARIVGVDAVVWVKLRSDGGLDDYLEKPETIYVEDEAETVGDDDKPFFYRHGRYLLAMQARLIDGYDGSLIWHFNKERTESVELGIVQSVEGLSRVMVRHFPYRNMDDIVYKREPAFVIR